MVTAGNETTDMSDKAKILAIAFCIVASGCTEAAREVPFGAMPDGLKDCRIFELQTTAGPVITVVRCPNSATSSTYRSGKVTKRTVVVDGVEYEKK